MLWLPYVYQYSIMLILFVVGIVIAVRSGQLRLDTKRGKRYLLILTGGFIGYMVLQGFMQFIAPII